MHTKQSRNLVWRGQTNAAWGLMSKLYRSFLNSNPHRLTENSFTKLEQQILGSLRDWGLHSQKLTGRLSILSQIAMLQHFQSPTRFIDVSFNSLVAAFFATEQDDDNDENDARLFAIDTTGHLINTEKNLREWEDSLDTPWSDSYIRNEYYNHQHPLGLISNIDNDPAHLDNFVRNWRHEWTSHYYVWKPPALDSRIAAQNGGFLFGGLIGSESREGFLNKKNSEQTGKFQVQSKASINETDFKGKRYLTVAEARQVTCVAIQPQMFETNNIRSNRKSALYTIRISAKAKPDIRQHLEKMYGFAHATIYPDFSGFAVHGAGKILRDLAKQEK
ncbi:FRG domain-containing protein [Brucella sp. TWI559]